MKNKTSDVWGSVGLFCLLIGSTLGFVGASRHDWLLINDFVTDALIVAGVVLMFTGCFICHISSK